MNNIFVINSFIINIFKAFLTTFIATTIVFASDQGYESSKVSDEEFLLEVSKNDVSYEKYDSPISQFDKFFGLPINYDSDDQINFGDLSLTVDSKNIRNLYLRKLESLTNDNDNNTNIFYKEKL